VRDLAVHDLALPDRRCGWRPADAYGKGEGNRVNEIEHRPQLGQGGERGTQAKRVVSIEEKGDTGEETVGGGGGVGDEVASDTAGHEYS